VEAPRLVRPDEVDTEALRLDDVVRGLAPVLARVEPEADGDAHHAGSCVITTRPRTLPPAFRSASDSVARSELRVSIGIGGAPPPRARPRHPPRTRGGPAQEAPLRLLLIRENNGGPRGAAPAQPATGTLRPPAQP